jgi:dinuclear metal center YbgI/SA1388 family protein
MADLSPLVRWLDRTLNVAAFEDASHNGLQVESSGRVRKVACCVDASLESFEACREQGADLVVCHHGISWGDSLRRITGIHRRRMAFLIRNDMALYACHLPLDAHPRVGNNILLCKALGLRRIRPFGDYHGVTIGFGGELPAAVPYARFRAAVARLMDSPVRSMDFGPPSVRTVAVVSGGAADSVAEAGEKGYDVFLSGEAKLSAYHLAREHRVHALFAGHYATEVFGVRAVADLIRRRRGIPAEFVDVRNPF